MLKRLLVAFIAFFMFTTMSFAQDITVLRIAKRGGLVAVWNDAIAQILTDKGYNVKRVNFDSCKDGYNWLQKNSTEPTIVLLYTQYMYMPKINPENIASCNFDVNEDTLVEIIGRWWTFVCGHDTTDHPVKNLIASDEKTKLGVLNDPIQEMAITIPLRHIGFKGHIVKFTSSNDMLMAYSSGDIDYLTLNSESLAKSLKNNQCFLTLANRNDTKQYMSDRTSFEEIKSDTPFIGFGSWPAIVAYNVNMPEIREIIKNNDNELFQKLSKDVIVDESQIHQQMKDINDYADLLKANSVK